MDDDREDLQPHRATVGVQSSLLVVWEDSDVTWSDGEVPEPDVFSCGCVVTYRIEDGTNVMVVSPCHVNCGVLAEIIQMGHAADKPFSFIEK